MNTEHTLDGGRAFRRLNLNQLYALDAILRSRTLTEAGHLVSLSQPAMSNALRRLRDHFADDLVRYRGGEHQLTALGDALRPRIGRVLRDASDAFDLSLDFDPGTADRAITLAAPEAIELTFLSRLVPDLMHAGPGLSVTLAPFDHHSVARMFERGADVAIVPETMVGPEWASLPLFDHRLAGMVWSGHTAYGDTLSADAYLGGRHAALLEPMEYVASFARSREAPLSERRIVVRTGRYLMLPNLVYGTDLIVTGSNWLIQYFASILPVRLVSLPISPRPMRMVAIWSPHRTNEPIIRWLVDRMLACAERLGLQPDHH